MVAAMQIILRPRPRGLDLLSRCGACLMQARLKNKSVLNAPPRTGAELRGRGSLWQTLRCHWCSMKMVWSDIAGLVAEPVTPVIFPPRARPECFAGTARAKGTSRRTAPARTAASPAASPVTSRPIALLANAARMQTHVHGRLQRVHSLRRRARLLWSTTWPICLDLDREDLQAAQVLCTGRPGDFRSSAMTAAARTAA